ncbi:zeta toxin family protein [Legionella cardiaca]|uniref:Zeta toxin family protein n=1 Tax=Legionella cardiaca TaxID=1071983 RepID=A0ABY8ASN7_9GAMM|nr:zeta toxin family protein [Legionella cardiaca]WED43553.1 zeta toxin family protein [Legionella cardiaca]
MPFLYTTKRINFGVKPNLDLQRHEYHRTLRQALELSATSYSYQKTNQGRDYQWDNIAPEVALVIIQDAEKQGIFIKKEVLGNFNSNQQFNNIVLDKILAILNSNSDYLLFTQKLALHLTNNQTTTLSLEVLKSAGITTIEQFDAVYSEFLLQQKKLSKNFPNFAKIKDHDDFQQLLVFLANNPLYDKFLKSFMESLANEFNQARNKEDHLHSPATISKKSLSDFLAAISYGLAFNSSDTVLKKNTLYTKIIEGTLHYTVITPDGREVTDTIQSDQAGFAFDQYTCEEELRAILPVMLQITAKRGHTSDVALDSTSSLKNKAIAYLSGEYQHDLFLSHLPSLDLVKDEEHTFCIYHWLQQGNLSRFKDHIANNACQRYYSELDQFSNQVKEVIDDEIFSSVNAVATLMKEIVALIASLDADSQEKDSELDQKISQLILFLNEIKTYYSKTPLLKPGESLPSTAGNFAEFVRKIIFNSTYDKVIQYVTDQTDQSKAWKIDLLEVINALMGGQKFFFVREANKKKLTQLLTDKDGKSIPTTVVFRDSMKKHITTQLKANTHHYYTLRSYENDNLTPHQAPVTFRGGNLTDTLEETQLLAKKITKSGEFSADSHLLSGQENNIKKHEVRSGTAATLFATTGADGTRAATDRFDIALQYGGDKDIKILYILRGKKGINLHPYLDPMGKNKLSETAYTHIHPSDYVMTILYDKNNTILDVIPGNLTGEIHGVNDLTKKVILAGLEFYNIKHNPNYAGTVKLPVPQEQETPRAHTRKSLIEILQSHKTTSTSNEITNQSGSVRIRRSQTTDGYKRLHLDNLLTTTKTVSHDEESDVLPKSPFKYIPGKLAEVKAEANRHYNMRHILTLKNFSGWSEQERKLQEAHNRILQPGFMWGNISEQLMHAKIAKAEWLTDVLAPKPETALFLNIAACLITEYRVDIEDVNELAKSLHDSIYEKHVLELITIEQKILQAFDILEKQGSYQQCLHKAKLKMTELYPALEENSQTYLHYLASCLEIEKNIIRKQMTNQLMSEFLDKYLDEHAQLFKIKKKTVHPLADNRDFVFLGPAASGKSTISSQYISHEDRKDYVSLATDDYRGIHLPFTERFEKQEIEQVFIRTQDSAFLISELVEMRMAAKKSERANVIVDAVTYKPSQRALVEKNKNSIIVCACLDDMAKVVRRSYERALSEDAGSADKGRYVNTNSLLEMHKTASLNLIKYCAPDTRIAFYDTNIPRGAIPPLIATVDTHGTKSITICNDNGALLRLASFFNKSRVNIGAKSDDSLFFKKLKNAEFQIDSLFTVMDFGYKVILNGQNNVPYLTVEKGTNGTIIMNILDFSQLKTKLSESSKLENNLLKMILLYGHYGTLKEVHKQCLLHDNKVDLLVDKLLESLPEEKKSIQTTLA